MWFDGFQLMQVNVGDGELRVRVGGSGPPLLLLHGNPQTHAMWHATCADAGEVVHRRLPRPARLRWLVQAARDGRSRAVREGRYGRRHGRPDAPSRA